LTVLTDHITNASTTAKSDASSATSVRGTAGHSDTAETASYSSNGVPYSVGMAADGTQYVYDGNGSPISVLPANYSSTPSTYIPTQGTYNA